MPTRFTSVLLLLCLAACARTPRSPDAHGSSGSGAAGVSAPKVDAGAGTEAAGSGQGGSNAGMGGTDGWPSQAGSASDSCPSDPATPAGYHKLVVRLIPSIPGWVSTSPAGFDRCTGPDQYMGAGCDPFGPQCGCSAPACSASFAHGTTITLDAHSDQGAVLHRWKGDCPDDGMRSKEVTITLDRDMTCIAEFGG
jgi:hypothetical protein